MMLGYSGIDMKACCACKKDLPPDLQTGRREECPFCGADLHCCLNCTFYQRTAPNQCREPIAEPVKEKQKANYCDYFKFAESAAGAGQAVLEKSRKQLDDLFKR